jgi:hypothetical protein
MGDSVTEAAVPEELDGTLSTPGTGVVTVCRQQVISAVTELTISWSCSGMIAEAGARGAAVAGRGELDEGTVVVVPEAQGVRARWEWHVGGTASGTGRLPVLSMLISSGGHCKIPAKHTQKCSGRILKAYGGWYKI